MTTERATVHAAAASPHGASDPRQEGPADLRIVAPALAAWVAAAVALGAPGAVVASACAVAVVLAAVALRRAAGRRRAEPEPAPETSPTSSGHHRLAPRPWSAGSLVAAAAVLLCAVAGAASAALHAADARRGPLPSWAQRYAHLTVELEVTGDPRMTRPKVRGSQRMPPSLVFTADVVRITGPDGSVTATRTPALVIAQQQNAEKHGGQDSPATQRGRWLGLLPSTRIRVAARAAPPMPPDVQIAAVLRVSADTPPRRVAEPSALQRMAGSLRAGLRDATDGLSPDARALLPGLVVGDTSRVPPDLDDAFRATDLTHLLAVSGSNLTIVLALLVGPPHLASRAERRGLAPRLGLSLRGTAVVGGALALTFVVVCRPDPSVLRAAACGLITLLAIGTGRRRSLLPALGTAVLLLILYDPWLARSYGFLLSVLATGALLLLAPRWSAALQRRRVPPRLAEVIAAAAAAQAVCAPVIVVLAARVGLLAVPCNLLAELAVAPATVLGFAALAAGPLVPSAAQALAWCAGWPATWIAGVARAGAALPGAEFGWPGGWVGGSALAVATVVLAAVGRRMLRRRWLCVLCALALILVVWRPAPLTRVLTGWPPPGWRAVVCDVGQGDGLVLAAGDGTALVVDAGPEPRAIDRCLTDLGVRRIPVIVLTHFHADHVDGLPGVLHGRSVGLIETTTLQDPPGQAEFVRRTAAAAGVPVTRAAPGERRRLGPLAWEVLWPPADTSGAASDGPNDASVTLLVRSAGLTLLLLGDLEPPAQQALLTGHPELPGIDVLKVAHHGSAHQDPELMRRVAPRLAVISVGADNPYGHPAPRTVDALRRLGAKVLRTDTDGAIAVLGTRAQLSATVQGRRTTRHRSPTTVARRRRRRRLTKEVTRRATGCAPHPPEGRARARTAAPAAPRKSRPRIPRPPAKQAPQWTSHDECPHRECPHRERPHRERLRHGR
ncbi:ComEC/Rec2 family competence protein [Streptomyces pinistramenti]|uniref:ComEC/Rec2 family competence protein n=1 Tax=Streptomyces pinistramenti TaxID=2884812 RepID=UPI001D063F37|nr:ComEC/Rec2 family competence protein [Streptomyces pinistramenti]MCB5906771.1 ComEC/Rec2 family competence protein [Streptomyces pinistramenti]